MSRQGSPFELTLNIRGEENFLENLEQSIAVSSSHRAITRISHTQGSMRITIKAEDFNILLAINNSMMQSLKMIKEVNLYE